MKTAYIIFKYCSITLLLLFGKNCLYASDKPGRENVVQPRAAERIYITTDRDSYVAGETMWLSLFLTDANNGHALSSVSSMAYLEFYNSDALVLTFKIAVSGGRGSGCVELPPSLPTGNYIIKAYTRQMLGEKTPEFFQKMVSVFNVLTAERVEENVKITNDDDSPLNHGRIEGFIQKASSKEVGIAYGAAGRLIPAGESLSFAVSNSCGSKITSSLSVFRKDSLSVMKYGVITDYVRQLDSVVVLNGDVVPDYEGEIISGRVITDNPGLLLDAVIFFSVAGDKSKVYSSAVDKNGVFTVYTTPFYGDRDVVLEMPYIDSSVSISYELLDPFVKEAPEHIPFLSIDSSLAASLRDRSIEMQVGRRFRIDTLFQYMHKETDPLLKRDPVVYRLDDYVRFPVMREVITEFIPQLRFRRVDKMDYLQVRMTNEFKSLSFAKENSLVLLDGIPLFKHDKILNYDPLKVESISIYTDIYNAGFSSFTGAVLFKTYKGNYTGLTLDGNAKIFDFRGALHPSRLVADDVRRIENLPDLRSLLYWDPVFELEAGVKKEVVVNTSSLKGEYYVVLEGMDESGHTISMISEFTVK